MTQTCEGAIEIRGELRGVCDRCLGQRPDHQTRPCRESIKSLCELGPQAAAYAVARDAAADRLTHDQPDSRRSRACWVQGSKFIQDDRAAAGTISIAHHGGEISRARHPMG
jgi:hypothetical protein